MKPGKTLKINFLLSPDLYPEPRPSVATGRPVATEDRGRARPSVASQPFGNEAKQSLKNYFFEPGPIS